MKVRIVGAGPAGLQLAILLAKADAAHDVEKIADGIVIAS